MEKIQNNLSESKVSSPLSLKDSSLGVKNLIGKAEIKNQITLTSSDWLGVQNGLIIIKTPFSTKTINTKYYEVIGTTETQRQILLTLKPQETQKDKTQEKSQEKKPIKVKVVSSGLDGELKQLENLTHLAKKFQTYANNTDKLRFAEGDKKILLERNLAKAKTLLSKYLKELRADPHFKTEGDYCFYSGDFVQAKKQIGNLGGF
jgi:hypothetical protein